MKVLGWWERSVFGLAFGTSILTGVLTFLHVGPLILFGVSAVALATLAAAVSEASDQLGRRFSPGVTGILQSAVGNLPELFVSIFALRAGLLTLVQTSLVGSILANSLLVLGLAFIFGGARHGTLHFSSHLPRLIATLTLLAVAALVMPTLAATLHTPAGGHEEALSLICAVVLLILFLVSIPFSIKGGPETSSSIPPEESELAWPLGLTLGLLSIAGIASAFVSDWFVEAIKPAIETLHISEAFTGLVIVAIAGNAVEHTVGIQFAIQNKADLAVSVILNSSLQIALALIPILVLVSYAMGITHLTLQLPSLLMTALCLTVILNLVIIVDGEANWLEGGALVGLYAIIATSFWWG
jgi:Ca2+:H+ antiporter